MSEQEEGPTFGEVMQEFSGELAATFIRESMANGHYVDFPSMGGVFLPDGTFKAYADLTPEELAANPQITPPTR